MEEQTIADTKDTKVKCTNCKCWREPADYIGKKGNIVKRCLKCREKDDRQKKLPHVRDKRNEVQREKKYYVAFREKKREENEEAYLAHNAEIAKNWRNNNKEHVACWKKNNPVYRITAIKQQAGVKGIPWDDQMTFEFCIEMIKKPCFYCNLLPDNTLNGIDRMDNTCGYCPENCVTCCKNCNFIKKALDAHTFVKRCQHISYVHSGPGIEHNDVWRDCTSSPIEAYQKRAEVKRLEFALSEDDFFQIKNAPCHYCNKKVSYRHTNGVDRKNNKQGYIITNCVPCCSECNQMKAEIDIDEFIEHCKRVSEYTMNTSLQIPEMNQCRVVVAKRKYTKRSKEQPSDITAE